MIRIIAPPQNLYFFGKIQAVDMEDDVLLAETIPGGWMELPSDRPIDLGVAWSRLGAPAVKLRFRAEPGHTYRLCWVKEDFAAGMTVQSDGETE